MSSTAQITLTPAQAATLVQSALTVQAAITAALAAPTGTYTRTQLSQARLAGAYTQTLITNINSLVVSHPNTQYVVRAGDTLQTIAQYLLGDATLYKAIMQANNIPDQNISPGQLLTLPAVSGTTPP